MYDVAGLPGTIVHHGGLGTHPHVVCNGHPENNPQYLPADIFLRRIETLAGAIGERRRHDETLHHITEGTVQFIGDEFFRQLARHLADALHVRYCFVTECTDDSQTRLRALAFWDGQGFAQNVEYPIRGTPCEKVIEGNICSYPDRIQQLFPEDQDLVTLGAESYAGVPLPNSQGKVLGHLVVMDNRPRHFGENELRILRIFANRAGIELERLRADRQVSLLNGELTALNQKIAATAARRQTLLEINNAIVTKLTRDELLAVACDALGKVIWFDRLALSLYDPDIDALRIVAYAGPYQRRGLLTDRTRAEARR